MEKYLNRKKPLLYLYHGLRRGQVLLTRLCLGCRAVSITTTFENQLWMYPLFLWRDIFAIMTHLLSSKIKILYRPTHLLMNQKETYTH